MNATTVFVSWKFSITAAVIAPEKASRSHSTPFS